MKPTSGNSKKGPPTRTNSDRNHQQSTYIDYLNASLFQRTMDTNQNKVGHENSYSRLAQNRKTQKTDSVFEWEHAIQGKNFLNKSQSKSPFNRKNNFTKEDSPFFGEDRPIFNQVKGSEIIRFLQQDLDRDSETDTASLNEFSGQIRMPNPGTRTPDLKRNSISPPPKINNLTKTAPVTSKRHPSASKIQEYQREAAKNSTLINSKSNKLQIDNLLAAKQQSSPSSRGGIGTESTTRASSRAGTKHLIREPDNLQSQPMLTTSDIIQREMNRLERKRKASISATAKDNSEQNQNQRRTSQVTQSQNFNTGNFGNENPGAANERKASMHIPSIDTDLFQFPPSNSRGSFLDGNSPDQSRIHPSNGVSPEIQYDEVHSFRPRNETIASESENPETSEQSAQILDTKTSEAQDDMKTFAKVDSDKDEKLRKLIIENRRLNEELAIEKNLREQQYVRLATEVEFYKQKAAGIQPEINRNSPEPKIPSPETKKAQESNEELRAMKTKTAAMNDKLKAKIKELEKTIETEKAQNQKYQEQIAEMNSQFTNKTQQLIEGLLKETAQRELSLRNELNKKNDEIAQLRQLNSDLSKTKTDLEEGFKAQHIEITRLREQLNDVHLHTDKIKNEYLRMDQNFKATFANKTSENEFLKKQLNELTKQKNIVILDFEQLKADTERIKLRNKELLTEIDALEADRKEILQQLKELKSKELGEARRNSKILGFNGANKGFFRLKNISDVHTSLKQVSVLFDELTAQLNRELISKAKAIKDRLREELSQIEMEIQFMQDNMILDDGDPNNNTWQLGEVPLTRDKSFTLGKTKAPRPNRPEKLQIATDVREVTASSIELDRNRHDEEEEFAAVYKELGKLNTTTKQ